MSRLLILLVIVALVSCEQAKTPTYKPYTELFDGTTALLSKWDSVPKPTPDYTMKVDSGWMFLKGDSLEGLTTEVARNINAPVKLPHRITAANHPMWYRNTIALDAPGVFHISGDDGVQLFVNGKQVKRLNENFFEAAFTGKAEVVVRVLNNAMQGGLRHFFYLSREQYDEFVHKKKNYIRTKHLVESASLFRGLTDEQRLAVEKAVDHPADSSILQAEQQFKNHPYITGPWIVKEKNSVRVMAMIDESKDVALHYGSKPDKMDHILTTSGTIVGFELPTDSSRVYYQLYCEETVTPVYSFDIAETSKFTFNAWADSQSGWEQFARNLSNIASYGDAFGLGAGDLVNNGSDPEEWREFYNVLSSSAAERPYYLVSGNHDYDGYYDDLVPGLYRKLNRLSNPHYYSWTYGECMFIALDPNEDFPIGIPAEGAQFKWLMNEIGSEAWKNAKWRFVFLHQPPYSQGWEGYSGDHFLRRLLEPIVEKTPIDFVISGHTHDYERLVKKYGDNETVYLVLGGGGGSLEPPLSSSNPKMDTVIKRHHIGHFSVSGDTVRFEAIDVGGKVMDKYVKIKQ